MIHITIQYYALFREQRGLSEETYQTQAETLEALYDELKNKYAFSLNADLVKPAVNNEFSPWQYTIKEGDRVMFIPPVAGG